MILAARSCSPCPSPQPSGRRRACPCLGSDYDRTRVLEVIPNTPWQADTVLGHPLSPCPFAQWRSGWVPQLQMQHARFQVSLSYCLRGAQLQHAHGPCLGFLMSCRADWIHAELVLIRYCTSGKSRQGNF